MLRFFNIINIDIRVMVQRGSIHSNIKYRFGGDELCISTDCEESAAVIAE